MKLNHLAVIGFLLMVLTTSCAESSIDSEQYKKETYLIGAYNKIWTIEVKYSEEPVEDFLAVSSSGSKNLDKDVQFTLGINEELVDIYNRKFVGVLNEGDYYEALDQSLYDIPSKDKEKIDYTKGISTKVPIFICTKGLDTDKKYVIPVQLLQSSPYGVNEAGKSLLISLKLINDYSGMYIMSGFLTSPESVPRKIQKNKVLTATGMNTLRMFYGVNNESDKPEELAAKAIDITISNEFVEGSTTVKKVSIKGWKDLVITDSETGTYDTVTKMFQLKYTLEDGTVYEEDLIVEPEIGNE